MQLEHHHTDRMAVIDETDFSYSFTTVEQGKSLLWNVDAEINGEQTASIQITIEGGIGSVCFTHKSIHYQMLVDADANTYNLSYQDALYPGSNTKVWYSGKGYKMQMTDTQ